MAAYIQGCFHIDIDKLEGNDDEKLDELNKLWSRCKFFLEKVHHFEWK
jgi:hypothetical protein